MEEKIANLMEKLDLTREEALQVIADDEAIDKGADLFPLTDEQKKNSKQARNVGRAVATKKATREKKADECKSMLLELLLSSIKDQELITNIQVQNDEREFTFECANRKFKVVLSAPRN